MSIGPSLPIVGSFAGAPLAQRASDVARTQQEVAAQDRHMQSGQKAEAAAGIGTTEEDQATEDRDADGRRLWEETAKRRPTDDAAATESAAAPAEPTPSRDPRGEAGTQLDICG